jgi:hypothetical protein
MTEPLLGCPHCSKPVGFAAAMAGQVVSCPHCRGPFQMPERPPATPPSLPSSRGRAVGDDVGFAFESGGATVKAELESYRAATTLATTFAIAGSFCVLLLLGLTIYTFVLPVFRGGDDRPGHTGQGIMWLIASFLFAGLSIVGLFLIRSCVLVGVDAARTLRAIERDALAAPKTK